MVLRSKYPGNNNMSIVFLTFIIIDTFFAGESETVQSLAVARMRIQRSVEQLLQGMEML